MSRYRITPEKFLNDAELGRLIMGIASIESLRNRVLFLTAIETGARAQELLNLTLSDISGLADSQDPNVYIRGIKGSNDRRIPISYNLRNLYREWLESVEVIGTREEHMARPVFKITYRQFNNLFKELAFQCLINKTIKALRHTFAINLYRQTKDLLLVKTAMGHRCITNTQVYLEFIYSEEELRKLRKLDFYTGQSYLLMERP